MSRARGPRCLPNPRSFVRRLTASCRPRSRHLLLLLLIGLATGFVTRVEAQRPAATPTPLKLYTIQAGDTCWSIAERFFGRGDRYTLIHEHNDLGPLPHLLQPGQQLKLPANVPDPDAQVDWLQKDVRARAPWETGWGRAVEKMPLWRLYRVSTGDGSSAGIRFQDRSQLRMRERALLVIYGQGAARGLPARPAPGTSLVLEQGTLQAGLERLDQEAELTIGTPAASVALRSKSSLLKVDELKSTLVSVYEGLARVLAQGAQVQVPADHGTVVPQGKRPLEPRPLLAPVRWENELVAAEVPALAGKSIPFELRWQPIPQALRYHLELARDEAFRKVTLDVEMGAGIQGFVAQDLAPADWYVRVAAIDDAGLEGRPSAAVRLTVFPLTASRLPRATGQGSFELVGIARLSPPADSASVREYSLDDGAFQPLDGPIRLLQPGQHRLRFQPRGRRGAPAEFRVHVLAVQGRLETPTTPVPRGTPGAPVLLRVRDERDRVAPLPGLTLTAYPGGISLELSEQDPGAYAASVPGTLLADGAHLTLVAAWAGGELDRQELNVEAAPPAAQPPAPPPPAGFTWPWRIASPEWGWPAAGLPTEPAAPFTQLRLTGTLLDPPDQLAVGDALFLRLALDGELALRDGRVGLTASLPWYAATLNDPSAARNELGDLRLGGRWLLHAGPRLRTAASFRTTLPTGGFARTTRSALLEPALRLELELTPSWLLATSQALVLQVSPGDSPGFFYGSGWALGWRPVQPLTFGLELQSVVGLNDPAIGADPWALALAGSIRWTVDQLAFTVLAGGPLREAARTQLGGLLGQFQLDLAW